MIPVPEGTTDDPLARRLLPYLDVELVLPRAGARTAVVTVFYFFIEHLTAWRGDQPCQLGSGPSDGQLRSMRS